MTTSAAHPAIRTFNLFGESAGLPDVVHCETIASRSVLHEWEFAAHRHAALHQILLIERGGGSATLEGVEFELAPMRVVNVPVGDVHGFSFRPGTEGWVVTLAAEMLDEVSNPSEGLARVLAVAAVLRGTAAMRGAMRQIFAEFAGRSFARAHVLRALTGLLIGLVARELQAGTTPRRTDSSLDLLRRFEALMERHHLEHWTVADYARRLAVSPTHLSRQVRAATGQAAAQLIRDRLMREARRNLVYTNLPISTVAYALGFDDPAYFSRVFAAATGEPPRAFRARAQKVA